jgi:hypothetical protein
MKAALERQIHLGIVQLLRLNAAPGVVWFHTANERRTTPREGAFLKRMGVLAGVADFSILIPRLVHTGYTGNYLHGGLGISVAPAQPAFLEIKRPGGRLSVAQEQFRDSVVAIGCLWDIAFSTDRAAEILMKWGAIRSHAPAKIMASGMRECALCVHVDRYRDRLCCKLFKCSVPFARDAEGECGPDAKHFKRGA